MNVEGYFNENDEPVVTLDLVSKSIVALIDTGFAGGLLVPQALALGLTLHFEGVEGFFTATGEMIEAPTYSVEVRWLDETLEMPISVSGETREALLGTRMLQGCLLTIDYAKRTVRIEKSG